jgi:integrase
MQITKRTVDAMQPGDTIRDDKLTGFECRCRKRYKTYSVLRRFGGKKQRWTIGKHGDLTPDQARKEAQRIIAEIALGRDPAPQRDKPDGMTVAQLSKVFLEQHAARLKPNSRLDYERQLRLHILPAFGKLAVGAVAHRDVMTLHSKMADTPVAANHVKRVIHKLFEFAKDMGFHSGDNPASRVKQYKEQPKERYLSHDEVGRLLVVLDDYQDQHVSAAIKLLLLTGCRKSEITTLEWDHVNLDRGLLVLPDSKTGAKAVVLSPDAVAVLAGIQRLDGCPWVIPSRTGKGCQQGLQWHWQAIRSAAGLDGVRLHDLRHSFASLAVSAGVPLATIGGLLGHKDLKSTARYAHLFDDALRDGAAAVGQAVKGKKG